MGAYIIRRILWMIVLLFAISFITFAIFYLLPSADPALLRAGRGASAELVASIRDQLGLDEPWYTQYWLYMKNIVFHFDFGYSYFNQISVKDQIFDRLPATITLGIGAMVIWLLVGIPIGIISAVKRGTWMDKSSMGLALVAISAPVYWLGLVSLYLFSDDLGVCPLFKGSGTYPLDCNILQCPEQVIPSLILPWIVLAASFAAIYARFLRGNLTEVLGEDYIRTARAKGLGERRVILRHGVRSAATPLVTILGLDLGILLGGAILTETVFNIPGIGRLVLRRDPEERPADRAGHGARRRLLHHLPEPGGRHRLRLPRSPRAVQLMAPLLEVRNLSVAFDTEDGVVQAVDGVSYTIERGQALGIVGESGSGKSVSSLTVMGLTRFDSNARISGEVLFEGRDLLNADDATLRGMRGQRDRDDLPGPAQLAASLLQDRRAAGRGDPRAPQGEQGAGARPRRRDARHWSGSPSRGGASTATRTSSPAACASA